MSLESIGENSVDVPIEVDTMKFASARAQEIAAISQALDEPKKSMLIFQRLPRHMRRRVMGHNAKRVPRNLQEAYTQQLLKSSGRSLGKKKTPSRKYRRRPSNLLAEYNRRQKLFVWLETHIWHAKRFHMTQRWGYQIAEHPNDRSYRACYRATANHCLLQDISFMCCIELLGPEETLLSGLSKHTDPCCGLTFGAQCLLDGSREGETMFYDSDQFPWRAVGQVTFVWKAIEKCRKSDLRSLWLWAHPAFHQEVVKSLNKTFGLYSVNNLIANSSAEADPNQPVKKKIKAEEEPAKNVEELKLLKRNVPFERTPKFTNASGSVQMVLLKDTLNRFRLTGPLSQAVLEEALEVDCELDSQMSEAKAAAHIDVTASGSLREVPFEAEEDCDREGIAAHYNFWKSIQGTVSPALLPPKLVLYLNVKDPRLQIPDKRTKAEPNRSGPAHLNTCPPLPCSSPVWSSTVRDNVTRLKLSTADMNSLRSKFLVPGLLRSVSKSSGLIDSVPNPSEEKLLKTRVPIVLIHRPGSQDSSNKRIGFGCGWDIIVPAGWAMPFWLAFIFRCARASGLREAISHELEKGLCEFLPPDTLAGKEAASWKGKQLQEAHFRLPPDKRPNFIKLGIACPFQCAWGKLIRDWISVQNFQNCSEDSFVAPLGTEPSFFVLRDINKLQEIHEFLQTFWTKLRKGQESNFEVGSFISNFPRYPFQEFSLIPVYIQALQKGVTDDLSLLSIPSPADVKLLIQYSSKCSLQEPPLTDKHSDERQRLRGDHKKQLLRLRRQRVRVKRKQERESVADFVKANSPKSSPTADMVSTFKDKIEKLWLPDTDSDGSILNSCSRKVAGFVTKGSFSFSEARGCGVGYITYIGLRALIQTWLENWSSEKSNGLKSPSLAVLVRSPNSSQYRLAAVRLILK